MDTETFTTPGDSLRTGAAKSAAFWLIFYFAIGYFGALTFRVLDTSIGPFGAPFSVSDVGDDQ